MDFLKMKEEIRLHLTEELIPFWKRMIDRENGGYLGYMDARGAVDPKAEKGCILNSRILWFFSNAAMALDDPELRDFAEHSFRFLMEHFLDRENGGVYWSVTFDGQPLDDSKHAYNQAFALYALSSYYRLTGAKEAGDTADALFSVLEENCRDEGGYLEAFDRKFLPLSNEKLSENGVMAERTMNTLLHVYEAYTEYARISADPRIKDRMREMLDLFLEKIYNPQKRRQEVFFDRNYRSLIDLHSYGHDIEASWLLDLGLAVLQDPEYDRKILPMTRDLAEEVYDKAFRNGYLYNERENGTDDRDCVWWVQAEGVTGYLNLFAGDTTKSQYREAAQTIWNYIREHVIDRSCGGEWHWLLDEKGDSYMEKPLVDPWKCPYHNGRMCLEVLRRL